VVCQGLGLFFIVGNGLQLLGQILFLLGDAQDKINYDTIIKTLLMTTIGVLIFVFCDRTIELMNENEIQTEETGV
tara:strand:+ start:1251 stop:1475 length:225 start_codon:yes stop_codon:yes gene_type:complete